MYIKGGLKEIHMMYDHWVLFINKTAHKRYIKENTYNYKRLIKDFYLAWWKTVLSFMYLLYLSFYIKSKVDKRKYTSRFLCVFYTTLRSKSFKIRINFLIELLKIYENMILTSFLDLFHPPSMKVSLIGISILYI